MAYRILKPNPNSVEMRAIESHDSPMAAKRALFILAVHEMNNGRVADYVIKPPVDMCQPEDVTPPLPPSVIEDWHRHVGGPTEGDPLEGESPTWNGTIGRYDGGTVFVTDKKDE